MTDERKIAYFSMEIGLESGLPTYSGGLGVLAGDMIQTAANMKLPIVAITLLHRKGYFYQKLDSTGWQAEEPVQWPVQDYLEELPQRTSVTIEGRAIFLRSWKYEAKGLSGYTVPIYFLDSNLPENSEWDRTLTDTLYGEDQHYRLCQEIILGIGGVRMLRELGYESIDRFHMNEGHSSLLTFELLMERLRPNGSRTISMDDIEAVRKKCVFTTHTPVPAGHDQFPKDLVDRVIGEHKAFEIKDLVFYGDVLNTTHLALNLSHYINGVAKKHKEVSGQMFAHYVIDSITNGVNAGRWTSEPFQQLFDQYIAGWREDNFSLRYALNIPKQEIWNAHMKTKKELIEYVNHETNAGMDTDILTIGFARRASTYKRADLLFQDVDRLKNINSKIGKIQVIYAGKAHPKDQEGKELIKRIYQYGQILKNEIKIAFLANYDIDLAKSIISGVDLWLNTPIPPLEASGTSGMKAALNGVPSLSILDGWWLEGWIEGITGWSIGEKPPAANTEDSNLEDAQSLYNKLEKVVIPLFYKDRNGFINVMVHAIALNGSFFNTQRMLQQYVLKAYFV
jgi:starch phosphorylase